jgi:hypothetical protein
LPVVEEITLPRELKNLDMYYGMNVSSSLALEPIDQLDGFLVAKAIQNQVPSRFYPFIAGVYGIFNSTSREEAIKKFELKTEADKRKEELLETVMQNLGLEGRVFTTNDLWQNDAYWRYFNILIQNLDPIETAKTCSVKRGMPIGKFPTEIVPILQWNLADCRNFREAFSKWQSNALYIPAEIAEAIWFNRIQGASLKIGPAKSEKIYDDIIKKYESGIIGLTQPRYIEKARVDKNGTLIQSETRETVPYIGRRGQDRITFSDTLADVAIIRRGSGGNPSFERALSLAEILYNLSGKDKTSSDASRIYELIKLGRKR